MRFDIKMKIYIVAHIIMSYSIEYIFNKFSFDLKDLLKGAKWAFSILQIIADVCLARLLKNLIPLCDQR